MAKFGTHLVKLALGSIARQQVGPFVQASATSVRFVPPGGTKSFSRADKILASSQLAGSRRMAHGKAGDVAQEEEFKNGKLTTENAWRTLEDLVIVSELSPRNTR